MDKEKVINYLSDQLFFTGFGDIKRNIITKAVDEALKSGKMDFQIVHDKKINNDSVRAVLNFHRSEMNPSMVFFNNFDLLVKKHGKQETLQQRFSTQYGNQFKLKEGYNLLDGHSVLKNFIRYDRDDRNIKQEYSAWTYLDFKDTDDYGNYRLNKISDYDISQKISEYPIQGLENDRYKNRLIKELSAGERVEIVLNSSNGDRKLFLEASPRFDSLNFYNEKMQPIKISAQKAELVQEQEQKYGQGQSASQKNTTTDNATKKTTKQSINEDQKPAKKVPKQSKGKGVI